MFLHGGVPVSSLHSLSIHIQYLPVSLGQQCPCCIHGGPRSVVTGGGMVIIVPLYTVYVVYPEPVYGVEREVTPRRQRQDNTRLRKALHYRFM